MLLLSAIFACNLHGQQIPLSKDYMMNNYAISPAFTGLNGGFEVFLQARKNLLGQVDSPEINKVSINGSVFDHVGVGLNVLQYRRGIFKTNRFETSYSYQILLKDEHIISFGLSAILLNNNINLASIDDLGDDPYFNFDSNFGTANVNFGTGIAYLYKNFRIGIAAPLLLNNTVKNNDELVYNTYRTLGAYAGYVFRYNELSIYPAVTGHYSLDYTYWEGSLLCQIRNALWGGLSYGKNSSIGICLGGAPLDNVIINYSFELRGSVANMAYVGSHEINIGVLINKKRRYSHTGLSMFRAYRQQPYQLLLED